MKKREYVTGGELTDKQWLVLEPLLPEPTRSRKGGQKPASNRACLEGILWILRSGGRWNDMPERFPSDSTCWRRMNQWHEEDVWIDVWRKLLGTLDEQGRLKWDEIFADGTFSSAKKGRRSWKNQARQRNEAYGVGGWSGHTSRALAYFRDAARIEID